jgi:hypothetical protein
MTLSSTKLQREEQIRREMKGIKWKETETRIGTFCERVSAICHKMARILYFLGFAVVGC